MKKNYGVIIERQNDMKEEQKTQATTLTSVKDLISLLLQNTKIKVSCNSNRLTMMTYAGLKALNSAYKGGWFCDGKKMAGCRGGKYSSSSDPDEYRYHCVQCSFDYCEKCFEFYGNDHEHNMQRLTHKEIMELHPGTYLSWGCDGRSKQSSCPQGNIRNETDVVYHDNKGNFDMCEACAEKYRID